MMRSAPTLVVTTKGANRQFGIAGDRWMGSEKLKVTKRCPSCGRALETIAPPISARRNFDRTRRCMLPDDEVVLYERIGSPQEATGRSYFITEDLTDAEWFTLRKLVERGMVSFGPEPIDEHDQHADRLDCEHINVNGVMSIMGEMMGGWRDDWNDRAVQICRRQGGADFESGNDLEDCPYRPALFPRPDQFDAGKEWTWGWREANALRDR